jgi:hypothetical protein
MSGEAQGHVAPEMHSWLSASYLVFVWHCHPFQANHLV